MIFGSSLLLFVLSGVLFGSSLLLFVLSGVLFGSSLLLFVLSGVHVFLILFVFIYVYWDPAISTSVIFRVVYQNMTGVISGAGTTNISRSS